MKKAAADVFVGRVETWPAAARGNLPQATRKLEQQFFGGIKQRTKSA
jgi:hypothetical protein